MYVIRETDTDGRSERVVMVTDDLTEAVNHFHADSGWTYITRALGTHLFHHADGRTAGLAVEADDKAASA